MKEQLESLNAVAINFGEGGMMAVNIILAFVMFGVALGIKSRLFLISFISLSLSWSESCFNGLPFLP